MENTKRTSNWINNLLAELSYLDDDKGIEILNRCGKDCCESSDFFRAAINIRSQHITETDDDKLFNAFKSQFYNSDKLTKNGKSITLIFDECTCPMAKNGVDHSFLCHCTLGYSKKIFETLFKKEVETELEKSILKGDSICKQHIKVLD